MLQCWATVCNAARTLYHHWTISSYQIVPKTRQLLIFLIIYIYVFCWFVTMWVSRVAAGLKKMARLRGGRGSQLCGCVAGAVPTCAGRGGAGTEYKFMCGLSQPRGPAELVRTCNNSEARAGLYCARLPRTKSDEHKIRATTQMSDDINVAEGIRASAYQADFFNRQFLQKASASKI